MRRLLLSLLAAVALLSVSAVSPALAATQFTIPQQNCPANQECDTAGVTMPAGLTGVKVTLTSSQWTNAALAGGKVLWGVAYSTNNGATWGPGTCDNLSSNTIGGASTSVPAWAYTTVTVGTFGRGGAMPTFAFSGGDMPPAGTLVRLFAWTTEAIPLGAIITIT